MLLYTDAIRFRPTVIYTPTQMHIAMTSAKGEAYAIAFMYNLHLTSWKVEPLHPQLRLSSKYQPQLMRQNHFFCNGLQNNASSSETAANLTLFTDVSKPVKYPVDI